MLIDEEEELPLSFCPYFNIKKREKEREREEKRRKSRRSNGKKTSSRPFGLLIFVCGI